jgi:hypothetical protein
VLPIHIKGEEKLFHPGLNEHGETRDVTEEGIEEHKGPKKILREMSEEKSEEQWRSKLKENWAFAPAPPGRGVADAEAQHPLRT